MTMSDLKHCPFCGGLDAYTSSINGAAFCEGCGAQGPWSPFSDVDWNTRAPASIKPLKWENFDAWTYWAETIVGTYRLTERDGKWRLSVDKGGPVERIVGADIASAEDGMKRAQEDFDSLVRGVME